MSDRELCAPAPGNRAFDWHFRRSPAMRIAIFLTFATLAILPIWLVKYPPLVDYPNHLARAFVLHHLNDPSYRFAQFYTPDWGLNPYCVADFLMQVFQHFMGIYAAGRVLLTLCVLSLPVGLSFFLRRANPHSEYLALWGFVVAYNPNLLMGFISFELSIALCFVVVGVWLDYLRTEKTKFLLWTVALATLLFLTHLGGFGMAGVAIVLYTIFHTGWRPAILERTVLAGVPFVPGCCFFLYTRLHGWAARGFDYARKWDLDLKLRGMLVPFRGYSRSVALLTILALTFTVAYFWIRRKQLRIQLLWIPIVLVIVAIHWALPDDWGDLGFVQYRFCVFAFLFALAIPAFRGPRTVPVLLASGAFLIHIVQVGVYFTSEQAHLSKLASNFQYIPPKAMVLAYTSRGAGVEWEKQDDLHFWGYGVIDKGWITPSLFHQSGVQPLQLRVPMYSDDDQYGEKLRKRMYTVDGISKNYDYLWATNVAYLNPWLEQVGNLVRSQEELEIFKSRTRPTAESEIRYRAEQKPQEVAFTRRISCFRKVNGTKAAPAWRISSVSPVSLYPRR